MIDLLRTPRLCLRCWRPDDAPLMKEAIDCSLPELRMWVPWGRYEPSPLDVIERRLTAAAERFRSGQEWTFGIFDPATPRVLGGAGLHRRIGPGGLEIGYWVRTDAAHNGFASEAAAALRDLAFAEPDVDRIEIRCDPENERSAAIPRRLGFVLTETLRHNTTDPEGRPRDTLVWTLRRPLPADPEA